MGFLFEEIVLKSFSELNFSPGEKYRFDIRRFIEVFIFTK